MKNKLFGWLLIPFVLLQDFLMVSINLIIKIIVAIWFPVIVVVLSFVVLYIWVFTSINFFLGMLIIFVLSIGYGFFTYGTLTGGRLFIVTMFTQLLIFVLGSIVLIIVFSKHTTTKTELLWEAKNIRYILDPNGEYIIMDRNTITQYKLPMGKFYEFREKKCSHIITYNNIRHIDKLNDSLDKVKPNTYICQDGLIKDTNGSK